MKHRRLSFFVRLADGQEGIALITVIIIVMIATIFGTAMVANLFSAQNQVARQRQITTARGAADAGVDRLVFELQQGTTWEDYATTYSTSSGTWWGDGANGGWWKIGKGEFRAHVDCDQFNCLGGDGTKRVVTVEGRYPAGSTGEVKTVQAVLKESAPAGLGFAMFADYGVTIHHHGSSWLSPTIATTTVHSNGGIRVDHSATFQVDFMEAVGDIELGAGGGNTPDGAIPAGGYNWAYHIPGTDSENSPRCYPSKVYPFTPATVSNTDPSFSTYWTTPSGSTCPGNPLYSPHAQVRGDVLGATVEVTADGSTTSSVSGTTCAGTGQPGTNDPVTGSCIPDRPGDIHGHTVKLGSTTYTGPASGSAIDIHYKSGTTPPPCSGASCFADCPKCNQGTLDQATYAGGAVYAHPTGWTPPAIDFPDLDYETIYLPMALQDQTGDNCPSTAVAPARTCHVFPTSDNKDLMTYLSTSTAVTSGYATSGCTTCVFWLDANKQDTTVKADVRYVIAKGDFYLRSGDPMLDAGTVRTKFGTPATAPPPTIMIAGSLVAPVASIDVKTNFTLVGPNMDPFQPRGVYPSTTVPGLLASGGNLHSSDYDTDSDWTSSGQYEPTKRNRVFIRGLAYSGDWDDASGQSTATGQHWHSHDPKNQATIIGAQVGGTLHNCNSFEFSYDPLIANLAGFTSGDASGVYVLEWLEL